MLHPLAGWMSFQHGVPVIPSRHPALTAHLAASQPPDWPPLLYARQGRAGPPDQGIFFEAFRPALFPVDPSQRQVDSATAGNKVAAAGENAIDAVIHETSWAAEHEHVTRIELEPFRVAVEVRSAEAEVATVAQGYGQHRRIGGGFVPVAVEAHASARPIEIDQASLGRRLIARGLIPQA